MTAQLRLGPVERADVLAALERIESCLVDHALTGDVARLSEAFEAAKDARTRLEGDGDG